MTDRANVDVTRFSRPAALVRAAESAHELALYLCPSAAAGCVAACLEAPQHHPSISGCSGRGASWYVC